MLDAPTLKTSLNRRWLIKMSVFLVALMVLGAWGTADAYWIYPARGRHHADFMLKDYLERLRSEGLLLQEASVPDPAGTLEQLRAQGEALAPASAQAARRAWLVSLSRLHNLSSLTAQNNAELARRTSDPSHRADTPTMFLDPGATLDGLGTRLQGKNVPTPLAAYDIPLQYLFMVLGFGGAAWMIVFLMRCKATVFRYDPEAKRLTLPDGRSFVPSEISEIDKREWHKYFMTFRLAGGGKPVRLDLLRFTPLENWALEMEKLSPVYVPPPAPEPDASGPAASGPAPPDADETRYSDSPTSPGPRG